MKNLKTKIAKRFHAEAIAAGHNAEQTETLAAAIDQGRMRIADARLAVNLTADWHEATIADLAADAGIAGSPAHAAAQVVADEDALLKGMAAMHGKALGKDKQGNPALVENAALTGNALIDNMRELHAR
ncbi:MAG: hypothetical protein KDJ29_20940 [Hyphomicrobiales bacterium]|nr:hypothetical protein [Hyphomicrobiales bacterium]